MAPLFILVLAFNDKIKTEKVRFLIIVCLHKLHTINKNVLKCFSF